METTVEKFNVQHGRQRGNSPLKNGANVQTKQLSDKNKSVYQSNIIQGSLIIKELY